MAPNTGERKTLTIRLTAGERRRIEQASHLRNIDLTPFIRAAALTEADRVIEQSETVSKDSSGDV